MVRVVICHVGLMFIINGLALLSLGPISPF